MREVRGWGLGGVEWEGGRFREKPREREGRGTKKLDGAGGDSDAKSGRGEERLQARDREQRRTG